MATILCQGMTKAGIQCKRHIKADTGKYCSSHKPSDPVVPMIETLDANTIEQLCQNMDLKTLSNFVRTNKLYHTICQPILNKLQASVNKNKNAKIISKIITHVVSMTQEIHAIRGDYDGFISANIKFPALIEPIPLPLHNGEIQTDYLRGKMEKDGIEFVINIHLASLRTYIIKSQNVKQHLYVSLYEDGYKTPIAKSQLKL